MPVVYWVLRRLKSVLMMVTGICHRALQYTPTRVESAEVCSFVLNDLPPRPYGIQWTPFAVPRVDWSTSSQDLPYSRR
jgi:hypothetical protein